jgi:hypothetical protein
VTYYVAVAAVAQTTYYIAVTAFDISSTGTFTPGQNHESAYAPAQAPVSMGDAKESVISTVLHEYPESMAPYPDLPNSRTGCFIATAAFGYYSEPNVLALRNFRDQFLITNGPGRAFVEWYYRVSPAAADYLNSHPAYKPLVRAALLPAVGMSLFLTRTSLSIKIAFLLIAGCFVIFLFSWKRLSRAGGSR